MMEEDQFPLTETVRSLLAIICEEQKQPPIDKKTRELLASVGEDIAIAILKKIQSSTIYKTFDGYIFTLAKDYRPKQITNGCSTPTSAGKRPCLPSSVSPFSSSPQKKYGENLQTASNIQTNTISMVCTEEAQYISPRLSFENETQRRISPTVKHQSPVTSELKDMVQSKKFSEQMRILNELEFRKLFLVLSYIGRKKVEDVMTLENAKAISRMKQMEMSKFESVIWESYGKKYCAISDRNQHNWDSAKTRFYHCNVNHEGYQLKGPYFECTRTHLQQSLGDDNVLIVKLEDQLSNNDMHKIAEQGIFVGSRHYQFFVFKDQRKKGKDNKMEDKKSSSIKCYFVHIEDENYARAGKIISNYRRRFMHVHTIPTIEKYMARFSLILSRTIKLQVDFGAVQIITIPDIPFRDENDNVKRDKEGNVLIHTDGTGFISEDLAMKCPKHFTSAKYITDKNFENNQEFAATEGLSCQNQGAEVRNNDPPLLMQSRLFHNGCAVKGTFLVNKKLKPGTIQVRPSMIKVEMDKACLEEEHFNSLEIVGVSCKSGRCFLSKHLIALLSYGRVPTDFFITLLNEALEDAKNVFSNKRVALRVATYNDGLDYGFVAQRMISSGIPLNEPYLQHCLSYLKDDKLKKLKGGKIAIGDSFYLMGTADPTGILNYDEVCIILDHGQIVGKVLVYRHPGLHFGDIHVMKAVHVKEMEEFVGNSKYGIFFSTKGGKSAAYEMSTGDFDGDLYWVSKNAELLEKFRPEKPWDPDSSVAQASSSRKPPVSSVELERELFQLFLDACKPSFTMAVANYSWHSFMDRLLTLGEGCDSEKKKLMDKMNLLINIYYDALDAPKSGKKVEVPMELRAELFPHHMGKGSDKTYHSTSVLGQIYDTVEAFQDDAGPQQEIWKIPCFDISEPEVGNKSVTRWEDFYNDYCTDMQKALNTGPDAKDVAANEVIRKYKKFLYEADEFEESKKSIPQIYKEALAIYQVTYNHVINERRDIGKCGFAWKVAGAALCHCYAWTMAGPKDRPMVMLPSVLRDLL